MDACEHNSGSIGDTASEEEPMQWPRCPHPPPRTCSSRRGGERLYLDSNGFLGRSSFQRCWTPGEPAAPLTPIRWVSLGGARRAGHEDSRGHVASQPRTPGRFGLEGLSLQKLSLFSCLRTARGPRGPEQPDTTPPVTAPVLSAHLPRERSAGLSRVPHVLLDSGRRDCVMYTAPPQTWHAPSPSTCYRGHGSQ